MSDLITDLKNTMDERGLSPEDASRFIGCSFIQVYRWLRRESIPTFLYRKAILRAIKKMKKLASVNMKNIFEARDLYRKIKKNITFEEKNWLLDSASNYSIYRERLKELAAKYKI